MYVKWYYMYLFSILQSVDETKIDIAFNKDISQFMSWTFYREIGQVKFF